MKSTILVECWAQWGMGMMACGERDPRVLEARSREWSSLTRLIRLTLSVGLLRLPGC